MHSRHVTHDIHVYVVHTCGTHMTCEAQDLHVLMTAGGVILDQGYGTLLYMHTSLYKHVPPNYIYLFFY